MPNATHPSLAAAPRYARALFQLAHESRQLVPVNTSVCVLEVVIKDDEIYKFISNPKLQRAQRKQLMEKLAKAVEAPPLLVNTLRVLAHNNRLALLPAVVRNFHEIVDAARGTVRARLERTTPFTVEQQGYLIAAIKELVEGANAVEMEEVAMPSLLAGFRVMFAGQVWDASVSGKLATLRQQMHRRARTIHETE